VRERALVAVVAVGVTLLSACGGERAEPAPEPTSSPAPPDTGTAALDLGQPRQGQAVTTTVVDARPGAGSLDVEVEQCLSGDVEQDADAPLLSTDATQWVVVGTDGTEVPGAPVAETPRPVFATATPLVPGECVSGWLALALPAGAAESAERVAWRPEGVATAEWLLR
jgi:hypothetical protein